MTLDITTRKAVAKSLKAAADIIAPRKRKISAMSLKTREEKALFKYILDAGKWRADYEANNSDSVPDALVSNMRADIADNMVKTSQFYMVGPYGHGFIKMKGTPADKRFADLSREATEAGVSDEFIDHVADLLRTDVPVEKPKDVDKRNQVRVFHWENQDMVEEQLDKRELDRLADAVVEISEDGLSRIANALKREDILWKPESSYSRDKYNDLIYTDVEGNGWDFFLDVDELEDDLGEIIAENE